MKRFNKTLTFLLSLLPYLTVFLFAMYSPIDPDLGWHLKYGEYFFLHGEILRDNTFATLMPNYHWANTSWLTDVISYGIFHIGGFLGLTLLGAIIVTLTFFFFSRVARLTLWDQAFLFPMLLYLEQPINAISFRGQQLSLLFMGIMFYIISFYPKKFKIFLLIIPLFFLWANLHGEFIFGLGLFSIWMILYILVKLVSYLREGKIVRKTVLKKSINFFVLNKKEIVTLVGIFLGSTAVTVLNPFGIGIHTAAISHFGSPLLKDIGEYLPFTMLSQPWWNQIVIGTCLVLGFIFLFFKGQLSERIPILGVSIIIFILSFEVRRYAWPAYYMILPMLTPLATFFRPDSKKVTNSMTALFLLVIFTLAIIARYPFTKYAQYNWNNYCQNNIVGCSPKAAEFLIKNQLTEHLYSLYGWGGWLIWNYPQIKPVIDGRMHLWRGPDGYSGFEDYYAYEQDFDTIDKSKYNVVFMSFDKPLYKKMLDLAKVGKWDLVYEDKQAGIFIRKD